MHIKAQFFELYDRNKCNSLLDASILTDIYIAQLIVSRSTRNQNAHKTEILKNTSIAELTVPKMYYIKI